MAHGLQGVKRQHGAGALTFVHHPDAAYFQPTFAIAGIEPQAFERLVRQREAQGLQPLLGFVVLPDALGFAHAVAGVPE